MQSMGSHGCSVAPSMGLWRVPGFWVRGSDKRVWGSRARHLLQKEIRVRRALTLNPKPPILLET